MLRTAGSTVVAETFSQRHGYKPVREQLQREDMDRVLRVRIWDFIYSLTGQWSEEESLRVKPLARVWALHYEDPIDTIPEFASDILQRMRKTVFNGSFNEVYDLVEFFADEINAQDGEQVYKGFNEVFERHMSAYRFVGSRIVIVDGDTDIIAIEDALGDTSGLPGVHHHLNTALALLADRDTPHYANVIKEAISAVEGTVQLITGDKKSTLGSAVKTLKGHGVSIPSSLEKGWGALYGYTSNDQGIRHAASEKPSLTQADAKYWLVTCSAFISLLLSQAVSAGLLDKSDD